ncbi:MAG: ABC transporter substrate-binding protein [Myxococcales bacterium]|nr:ABC transporter substrate-binding protein [Myxococcales bacterium]
MNPRHRPQAAALAVVALALAACEAPPEAASTQGEKPSAEKVAEPGAEQAAEPAAPEAPAKDQAAAAKGKGQYFPGLMYRSGPYAPNGIPFANGYADYLTLLQERDGGIQGVPIAYEECDTAYNNDRGVECYERLKGSGPSEPASWSPLSTGITYALLDRVTADKAPLISMGYGRADASDGRVFPYVFTLPVTYWAGADAMVQYIKAEEKGSLKGKKIALVYHDSAYGKEPIATLEMLAEQEGFELSQFAVAHPGLEQKSTWMRIGRQLRPDWVLMWGWGVMNSTAVKEAAAVGFPMNHFIGVWWSGSENDVLPAGKGAVGYRAAAFNAAGDDFPLFADLYKHVYDKGKGRGDKPRVGEALYNRGLMNAVLATEAVRTAQNKYGKRPLTGEEVRWGVENLDITEARLKELGLGGFMPPVKLSCTDHEGGGSVFIQEWDGQRWKKVSDWISPNRDKLRPMYEQSAAQYAKEKGIELRDCSQGG